MAVLKYWHPVLKWLSVVADTPEAIGGDDDSWPDVKGIYGGVTVSAELFGAGAPRVDAIKASTLAPAAALIVLAPIEARLNEGDLMLTADQQLYLVAQCPALSLPVGVELRYRFAFHDVTFNKQAGYLLPQILVKAPAITEPDAVVPNVNLVTAEWLTAG